MELVEREAIRAILLAPAGEVLLMRIRNPGTGKEFWICPGGGIETGEEPHEALARELREELGFTLKESSAPVHLRHHTFRWKERLLSQRETFVVVLTERFEPVISDAVEAEVLQEFRWWPLAEIDGEKHAITPPGLQKIVRAFRESGAPTALEWEIVPSSSY